MIFLKTKKNGVKRTPNSFFYNKKAISSLFKLVNSYYWKSVFGPITTFFMPAIYIVLIGFILGYENTMGGFLSVAATMVTLGSMPTALFEFKNSSLLKRIGATPIKPVTFLLTISSFYFLLIIAGTVFSLLFSIAVFSGYWNQGRLLSGSGASAIYAPSLLSILSQVSWGQFVYGQLINVLVALAMGLAIVSISKAQSMVSGICMALLITTQFISGQILPIVSIKQIPAIWYLGYILSPFKSGVTFVYESWNGSEIAHNVIQASNIFDSNPYTTLYNGSQLTILSSDEKIVSHFVPYIWMLIFGVIALKKFKWSNR